ncbi:hypothetical protein M0805_007085 [Coniferiporia weirii]|nr:hypothetical protein M0805_007085 [Coniferiporia weirii]
MSSWSASHPPPPHNERSRSPSRGAYGRPAYPDAPYAPDQYRDWDAYNRERAWADWERDRAVYDYGRRGRSRSPPFDDLGRKRRRSMSPYDRERYDPRPRYDDYDAHRGYGHSPPRSRGQYGHGYGSRPGRAAPVDPHTLDYAASLKQYAEWFRYCYPQQATEEDIADKAAEQEAGDGSKPRNGIKAKWEKYKKDFLAQQLQTLFDHHRKSPWFAEKYDPSAEYANLRSRVRKVGWRGRMNQFVNDLEDGKFDKTLNESEPESSEPIKEEGLAAPESGAVDDSGSVKQEDVVKNEDEFGMGMEGEEEAADNAGDIKADANGKASLDAKRPGKDEISVMPEGNQVMIRTIPPDIGRVKLEAAIKDIAGFVYLALGDPMQKRNYYRAGWIRFTEYADMPKILATLGEKKIEGFKLHVNHNTRPFSNKVRYAPEVASKPDRIAKDLEQVKKLVALNEEEYERVRTFRQEALPFKEGAEGAAAPERNGSSQDKDASEPAPPAEDVLMTDALAEDGEPREKGSEAVERRIAKLVSDLPEPASDAEARALETKKNTIALDLYLAYLRAAFHTCYYCASVSDHLEELQRKCIKHVRKPLSKLLAAEVAQQSESTSKVKEEDKDVKVEGEEGKDGAEKGKEDEKKEKVPLDKSKDGMLREREKGGEARDWKRNDERWLDWLDNRIALLINRDGVDVRDYGGKHYDDELAKAVEPHIKQEDEGKFRCKTCAKLFKATSFVEKHVVNKHSELVRQLEDIPFYNNFALDPQRIQPFTHYPQPVGNGQGAPPQAYGFQNVPQPYMDHGRGGAPASYYPYPPPYPSYANGHADPYVQPFYAYPPPLLPQPARSLRDEPPLSAGGGRRLGDRIGGYAPGHSHEHPAHGIEGLPAKPVATLEPGPGGRRNGRGPPPPPPPDAKEDPRAAAGRKVSYHDMDLVAEGDIELTY